MHASESQKYLWVAPTCVILRWNKLLLVENKGFGKHGYQLDRPRMEIFFYENFLLHGLKVLNAMQNLQRETNTSYSNRPFLPPHTWAFNRRYFDFRNSITWGKFTIRASFITKYSISLYVTFFTLQLPASLVNTTWRRPSTSLSRLFLQLGQRLLPLLWHLG